MANNTDTGKSADVAPNTIDIVVDNSTLPDTSNQDVDVTPDSAEIERLRAQIADSSNLLDKMKANNKELLNEKKNERAKRQAAEDERQREQGSFKELANSLEARLKEVQTSRDEQDARLKQLDILEQQATRRNALDETQYQKAIAGMGDELQKRFFELYPEIAPSEDGSFTLSPEDRLDRISRFNSAVGSIADPKSLGGGGNAGTVDNSDSAKLQGILDKPANQNNNLDLLRLMK